MHLRGLYYIYTVSPTALSSTKGNKTIHRLVLDFGILISFTFVIDIIDKPFMSGQVQSVREVQKEGTKHFVFEITMTNGRKKVLVSVTHGRTGSSSSSQQTQGLSGCGAAFS